MGLHHWRDCLDSYVTNLRGKTKRNGWKYSDKSIREREANIREFTHLVNKPFVEHYTTADMLRYKEHLYSLGRANDTVLNKLSCIVTWLRRNGLVSIVGLLPGDERPERRDTEGHPYSETEVDKMMEVADSHKLLLSTAVSAIGDPQPAVKCEESVRFNSQGPQSLFTTEGLGLRVV
jgi:hypothetical protein